MEPLLPLPARNELVLSHVVFTQFLSEQFGFALGKLDTTGGDMNEFAHGRGDIQFMNLALQFNPVPIRVAPYSTLGMGLFYLPIKDLILSFSVLDTEGVPNRTGFDTLFKDGTTLGTEGRLTIRPFGLAGHQLVGFSWSNKKFILLEQDPRTVIGDILFGAPLRSDKGSWVVYYNFRSISLPAAE